MKNNLHENMNRKKKNYDWHRSNFPQYFQINLESREFDQKQIDYLENRCQQLLGFKKKKKKLISVIII